MFQFESPLALLLLLLIPLIVVFRRLKHKPAGLRFSSTKNLPKIEPSLRQRLIMLPYVLRLIALALIILAIARPQAGQEFIRDISKGVAIEMVVDHSSSMQALKLIQGREIDRLDVVKKAFSDFVMGNNQGLEGRPNDLVGLVAFARYAETLCPLTLSHGALDEFIKNMKTVVPGSDEDGTSIGDGIALAAARLAKAEETLKQQSADKNTDYQIKSKVIILLSDGDDTGIGKRTPLAAAKLAKEWGIKIYSIGLTGDDWYVYQDSLFGRQRAYLPPLTGSTLKSVAEETGGLYRTADDIASLQDVYREINDLEKSEIESIHFLDYYELFMYFLMAALALLIAERILNATLFRRIP
ncbi:MAG: VWA domain-containing protein [Spirochaetales bacterium]|nr:VWA domain-containing protein [Spirochaetales bacterium]